MPLVWGIITPKVEAHTGRTNRGGKMNHPCIHTHQQARMAQYFG
jgi:hypothetical protein